VLGSVATLLSVLILDGVKELAARSPDVPRVVKGPDLVAQLGAQSFGRYIRLNGGKLLARRTRHLTGAVCSRLMGERGGERWKPVA
jgi:hypothetical protein